MTDTATTSHPPAEPPHRNRQKGKTLTIAILATCLLGTWAYLLYDKSRHRQTIGSQRTTIQTLDSAKTAIQLEFDNALVRLDSITGANNELQTELAERRKDIEARKAEIRKILNGKKSSEAELSKARLLIGELNDRIGGLEAEVARLTGENQQLNADNTSLRKEKSELETDLARQTSEKEDLERTVDVGSTFSASNIRIVSVNEKNRGKERSTSVARRVDKLVVSFDIENRIARSGPADLYLIVKNPEGQVIREPGSEPILPLNTRSDGEKSYTVKMNVEYTQGTRKNIEFPIRYSSFSGGIYRIEIYHNGYKIGEALRNLK